MSTPLLLTQIFCCFALTGLIWLIQLVHYPSFEFVDGSFLEFHRFHSQRISWIVIPLMLAELGSAVVLAAHHPQRYCWNLLGVILIWLSTFFWSVPLHNQLSQQKDLLLLSQLVWSNWPRTFLWSLRSGFWIYELAQRCQ